MKGWYRMFFFLLPLLLAACGTKSNCPEGSLTYLTPPYPTAVSDPSYQPQLVEINGQQIEVDRVITGPVCNDTWEGVIYLTCNIQVPAWEEDPFFWQDCDLKIKEDTVVYVEAHHQDPYSKGCSCHE